MSRNERADKLASKASIVERIIMVKEDIFNKIYECMLVEEVQQNE